MSTKKNVLNADEVLESVHGVMHLYRALQFRVLRDSTSELSQMEFKALGYFARHPGATLSDLVAYTGRDKAQIARLTTALKQHGLLEARPDEKDRRSVRLLLTPAGQEIHEQLRAHSHHLAEQALTGLDGAERAVLVGLLQRVRSNLEREA